jgi:RNA polymerase sigma-70 factor (ECF subfamily)
MMKSENHDEQIVKWVIGGNIKSYEILVKRYQNQIYSIGMRFFKNKDDASDFAQEIFIRAFQKLDTYRGIAPFRYWLTKIAYNHGANRIRQIKTEQEVQDYDAAATDGTPEQSHEDSEVKKILMKAMDQLPEKYKICIDLYFFLGLQYSQISEITDIPVNTIKSNVFRAKQILRDKLKGTIAEDYNEMQ